MSLFFKKLPSSTSRRSGSFGHRISLGDVEDSQRGFSAAAATTRTCAEFRELFTLRANLIHFRKRRRVFSQNNQTGVCFPFLKILPVEARRQTAEIVSPEENPAPSTARGVPESYTGSTGSAGAAASRAVFLRQIITTVAVTISRGARKNLSKTLKILRK